MDPEGNRDMESRRWIERENTYIFSTKGKNKWFKGNPISWELQKLNIKCG